MYACEKAHVRFNKCMFNPKLSLYDPLPLPLQYSKEFSIHEYKKALTEPTENHELETMMVILEHQSVRLHDTQENRITVSVRL